MTIPARGPLASRLPQRKFELLRQFKIPHDLLPGSLTINYTRYWKPSCHCAKGEGDATWSLVFMAGGKRHAQRIREDWVDDVQRRVRAGREVLAVNLQLLVGKLTRR